MDRFFFDKELSARQEQRLKRQKELRSQRGFEEYTWMPEEVGWLEILNYTVRALLVIPLLFLLFLKEEKKSRRTQKRDGSKRRTFYGQKSGSQSPRAPHCWSLSLVRALTQTSKQDKETCTAEDAEFSSINSSEVFKDFLQRTVSIHCDSTLHHRTTPSSVIE